MKKNMLCITTPESEESVSPKKRLVIMEELVKGQEAATQLKFLLEEGSLLSSQEELMANVLRSFTQSLSIINSSSSADSGENGSPPVPGSSDELTFGDCCQISRKRSQKKTGRGHYNRRRSAVTWSTLSCTIDDNHAWRKYGQKGILNSEFPRSYYRCSHKYDRGCRATKQVQRDQENPEMYQTTYIGNHTCNDATNTTTDLLINSDPDDHIRTPQDQFPKEDTTSNADNIVYSCTDSQSLDMDFGVTSIDHFGTDFHFA